MPDLPKYVYLMYYSDYEGDQVTGVYSSMALAKRDWQAIQSKVNPGKPRVTWQRADEQAQMCWISSDYQRIDRIRLNEAI